MRNPATRRFLVVLLISLPIVLFYAFVWRYAVGIPFQDDFDGILEVVQKVNSAEGIGQKVSVFLLQDDEHRVVFNRIVTYALYSINGEVNLKYHLFLGCLLILGIFCLIGRTFMQAKLPIWGLIPVSLLLFQVQYHEGIFWSMIPCQNFAVLFFAVVSIFLVSQNTVPTLIAALFVALLGSFSSGNGVVMLVPCLLVLLYQRRFRTAGGWAIWTLFCIGLYFHNLVIPAFRPKLSDNLVRYPLNILADFPAFMGQFFDPGAGLSLTARGLVTIPFGLVIIGWVLFLCWKLIFKTNPKVPSPSNKALVFWVGVLLFITATAFLFSIARAGDGFAAVFRSRYKLTLAVALVLVYCTLFLVVHKKWQKLVFVLGLGVGLVANAFSYYKYTADVINFRRDLMADMFSWKYGNNLPTSPVYFAHKNAVDSIIQHSLDNHYYTVPTNVFTPIEAQLTGSKTITSTDTLSITSTDDNGYVRFGSDTFVQGPQLDDGAYIVLKSDRETHLFPAQQRRNGLRRFITTQNYYCPGFDTAPILKKGLSVGLYKVFLVEINNQKSVVKATNQTVVVKSSFKKSDI